MLFSASGRVTEGADKLTLADSEMSAWVMCGRFLELVGTCPNSPLIAISGLFGSQFIRKLEDSFGWSGLSMPGFFAPLNENTKI